MHPPRPLPVCSIQRPCSPTLLPKNLAALTAAGFPCHACVDANLRPRLMPFHFRRPKRPNLEPMPCNANKCKGTRVAKRAPCSPLRPERRPASPGRSGPYTKRSRAPSRPRPVIRPAYSYVNQRRAADDAPSVGARIPVCVNQKRTKPLTWAPNRKSLGDVVTHFVRKERQNDRKRRRRMQASPRGTHRPRPSKEEV